MDPEDRTEDDDAPAPAGQTPDTRAADGQASSPEAENGEAKNGEAKNGEAKNDPPSQAAPPPLFREADLAGRLIHATEHTTIHQAAYRFPGYLIVTPKSAAETLGALSPEALADFFGALLLAETFVQRVLQPERTYLLKFAEFLPQLHMHVIPRTGFLGKHYEAATREPHPYNGAALTAWLWDHHGTLGFKDDDLDLFVTRARAALGAATG